MARQIRGSILSSPTETQTLRDNLSTLNLPAIDALTLARADGDCDTSEHKHGCRNKFMARCKEFHAPNIRLPSPAPPQLSRQLKHETRVCAAN